MIKRNKDVDYFKKLGKLENTNTRVIACIMENGISRGFFVKKKVVVKSC